MAYHWVSLLLVVQVSKSKDTSNKSKHSHELLDGLATTVGELRDLQKRSATYGGTRSLAQISSTTHTEYKSSFS